jgi:hypothetical protein
MRAVVGMKDDFYNRHLTKNHLFGPLLTLFEDNGVNKTNLIHSAIIELFEFIRTVGRPFECVKLCALSLYMNTGPLLFSGVQENVKVVLEDLMDNHREQLVRLANVAPTLQGLITKYEQNTDSGGERDGTTTER